MNPTVTHDYKGLIKIISDDVSTSIKQMLPFSLCKNWYRFAGHFYGWPNTYNLAVVIVCHHTGSSTEISEFTRKSGFCLTVMPPATKQTQIELWRDCHNNCAGWCVGSCLTHRMWLMYLLTFTRAPADQPARFTQTTAEILETKKKNPTWTREWNRISHTSENKNVSPSLVKQARVGCTTLLQSRHRVINSNLNETTSCRELTANNAYFSLGYCWNSNRYEEPAECYHETLDLGAQTWCDGCWSQTCFPIESAFNGLVFSIKIGESLSIITCL